MFTYKISYEQNFTDSNSQNIEIYTSKDVDHDYQYQSFNISFETKSNIYIFQKNGGISKLGLISLIENGDKNYLRLSELDKSLIINYIPFGRKSGDELSICSKEELQFINLPIIDSYLVTSFSDIKGKLFEHKTDEEMTEILDKLGFNIMSVKSDTDVNDFINQDEFRMQREDDVMKRQKSGFNEHHRMVDENQELEKIFTQLGLNKNNINLNI